MKKIALEHLFQKHLCKQQMFYQCHSSRQQVQERRNDTQHDDIQHNNNDTQQNGRVLLW
jgi:hypothetical protein